MATVVCDEKDIILVVYVEKSKKFNSQYNVTLLDSFHHAVEEKLHPHLAE